MTEPTGIAALRIDRDARPVARPRRWAWPALALLAAAAATAAAVLLRPGAPTVEVATARAPGAAPAAVLNGSGYLTARRKATVAATITGRVVELLVEEGQQVAAGQVLARLDDTAQRAQLAVAEAERAVAAAAVDEAAAGLGEAERTLARSVDLVAQGMVSPQDLDRQRTAAELARLRLEGARLRALAAQRRGEQAGRDLDDCVVRAPFAGIAVSKNAQVGEIVSPVSAGGGFTRSGIATIVDMASLEIEVDVNEDRIARVAPGQAVEAVLDAHPGWRIPARVRTVIPTADRQKATVKVRIAVEAQDPRLLPDMGVKVAFQPQAQAAAGSASAPAVRVLVPAAAVRGQGAATVVFLVRDGRAERRAVTVGPANGSDLGIVAGLAAGDRVVVGGPADLADGQEVRERTPSGQWR
jgi:HlyD family secretion protein